MPETERAFGYICPKCGKAVCGLRSEFALQAAAAAVVCDCAGSELTAENDGLRFRLTIPCGICGGEHRAEVDARAVLQGNGVALACPKSHQLCCYIGERERVEASLRELEITAEKEKNRGDEAFVDNVIMYEVLSELRDMAARGALRCRCGENNCAVEIHGAAVDLVCSACGGRLRLPAATGEDLDRLCCNYTLTIPGRG